MYARLLALGRGARLGLSAADTVVERARDCAEAFIVVEGRGAVEIARALGQEVADAEPETAELEEP